MEFLKNSRNFNKNMKYTIEKLFVALGFKKTYNEISKDTAVGKYASMMFENVSSPLVSLDEACAWVKKHKQEVINKSYEK